MTATATIRERIASGLRHFLKIVDPDFRERSDVDLTVEGALSTVVAPEIKQLERFGEQCTREACPATATSKDKSDLGRGEAWGRLKLGREKYLATGGTYTIALTGAGTVDAGAMFVNPLTDLVYILQESVTAPGNGTVKSAGTGVEVALEVGDTLASDQKFPGVDEEATVTAEVTEPIAAETFDDFMVAVRESFRATPRGGAPGDYRVWAGEVVGVYKVYPYSSWVEIGDTRIYVQSEKTEANPSGIPEGTVVTAVETKIEEKEPMTAGSTYVSPIIGVLVDITISGLSDSAKESQIEELAKQYLYDKEPFIAALDSIEERLDHISNVELHSIIAAAILPATISSVDIRAHYAGTAYNDVYLPNGTVFVPEDITFS